MPRAGAWEKGTSGNPLGRPKKGLSMKDQLERALKQYAIVGVDGQKLKMRKHAIIINRLIEKAMNGDMAAIIKVLEYTMGRPAQSIQLDGDLRQTMAAVPLEMNPEKRAEMISEIIKQYGVDPKE